MEVALQLLRRHARVQRVGPRIRRLVERLHGQVHHQLMPRSSCRPSLHRPTPAIINELMASGRLQVDSRMKAQ